MSKFHDEFDQKVWSVVSSIPGGQVMGYGEVARAAGFPRYSRMVSSAMSRSPEPLPWYRVVKSDRTLAFEQGSESYREQAQLLKQEGVRFEGKKIVAQPRGDNLDKILWGPQD
ncbi:MAG: methylated-DNA--[protein]-cysteine S-methyltransferase [Gammaproteobacteria bacterium]|nr:methylated-DNA--[protein]-cysteine S-methyltransferase [Gammaproteobacteria bacterium]